MNLRLFPTDSLTRRVIAAEGRVFSPVENPAAAVSRGFS